MTDFQIIVLALVQGITEFLPISSSAHLVMVPVLTGWPDQGLLIDIAVHIGSLGAVVLYFRDDVGLMLRGLVQAARGRFEAAGARLVLLIALATVPVVLAGLALKTVFDGGLRSIAVIGWASLLFGVLLYAVDRVASRRREVAEMRMRDALLIGLAQALALIPGTSRAGITITAARALGFERDESARFSMLMSIPTILAAGGLLVLDVVELGALELGRDVLLAAILSFLAALAAIAFLMRWLRHASFTPFVIYRCALGVLLLAWVYG